MLMTFEREQAFAAMGRTKQGRRLFHSLLKRDQGGSTVPGQTLKQILGFSNAMVGG